MAEGALRWLSGGCGPGVLGNQKVQGSTFQESRLLSAEPLWEADSPGAEQVSESDHSAFCLALGPSRCQGVSIFVMVAAADAIEYSLWF